MILRCKVHCGSQLFHVTSPHSGSELGFLVIHIILKDSIVMEDMLEEAPCSLEGCGELRQRSQQLGKVVNEG